MSWTAAERDRFEQGVIDALEDDGVKCEPVAGSLRVTLGGSIVQGAAAVVTWVSNGSGKLTHARATVPPAELGNILRRCAEPIAQPPSEAIRYRADRIVTSSLVSTEEAARLALGGSDSG